jgi:Tfp pilus assembly protein PilZ
MMEERRSHKRFRLGASEINGKMVFATEVKILDISIGGVSVKADRRLNMGNEYVLKLEDRDRFISVKGVVVWSSLSGTREAAGGEVAPVYTAGMRFSDISAETVNELLAFVEHHDKGQAHLVSGRRLNVRFRIRTPKKVLLQYPEQYRVKTISLSGMLIETAHSLDVESRVPMELSLQDDAPITFMGRIASCQLAAKEAGVYAIGIEFLDLRKKDKEVLSAFVAYCAASQGRTESSL